MRCAKCIAVQILRSECDRISEGRRAVLQNLGTNQIDNARTAASAGNPDLDIALKSRILNILSREIQDLVLRHGKAQMVSAFTEREIASPFRLISGTARRDHEKRIFLSVVRDLFMRAGNCRGVKCRLEAVILVGFKVRKAVVFEIGTQIPALAVFTVVSVHASCSADRSVHEGKGHCGQFRLIVQGIPFKKIVIVDVGVRNVQIVIFGPVIIDRFIGEVLRLGRSRRKPRVFLESRFFPGRLRFCFSSHSFFCRHCLCFSGHSFLSRLSQSFSGHSFLSRHCLCFSSHSFFCRRCLCFSSHSFLSRRCFSRFRFRFRCRNRLCLCNRRRLFRRRFRCRSSLYQLFRCRSRFRFLLDAFLLHGVHDLTGIRDFTRKRSRNRALKNECQSDPDRQ